MGSPHGLLAPASPGLQFPQTRVSCEEGQKRTSPAPRVGTWESPLGVALATPPRPKKGSAPKVPPGRRSEKSSQRGKHMF